MRNVLSILLLTFISLSNHGQEVFRLKDGREAIFAGFYSTDFEKEMLYGKDIISVPDSLIDEQTGQLTYKELVEIIANRGYTLHFEGYEPFWDIQLYRSEIKGSLGENPIELNDIEYFYNKNLGWGWAMAFKSRSTDLYGVIERNECSCTHTTDGNMVNCSIFYKGVLYQSCAYWQLREE